jgi:hypothetical protein
MREILVTNTAYVAAALATLKYDGTQILGRQCFSMPTSLRVAESGVHVTHSKLGTVDALAAGACRKQHSTARSAAQHGHVGICCLHALHKLHTCETAADD